MGAVGRTESHLCFLFPEARTRTTPAGRLPPALSHTPMPFKTAPLLARAAAIAAGLDAFPSSKGNPPPPASLARWRSAVERFTTDARAAVEVGCADMSIFVAVADLNVQLRDVEGGRGGCGGSAVAAASHSQQQPRRRVFVRHTTKFLVAPGKEAEVAVVLASRLDASLVGSRAPLSPPPGWAGGTVTSVYLDTPPAFPVHAARSAKEDGATLSRVRWYGDAAADGTRWVETKTHREPGSAGGRSSKERVDLAPAIAARLLDAAVPPPPGLPPLAAALAASVRDLAQPLQPVLATRAQRLAFEGAGVRVTLDQGLTWFGGDGCAAGLRTWVLAGGPHPPSPAPAQRACPFAAAAFAVLEVKVPFKADGSPCSPPPWLAELVADPSIAAAAPRLSKYLAGAVALFPSAGLDPVGSLDGGALGTMPPASLVRDGDSATSVEVAPVPPLTQPKPVATDPPKPRGLALPWKKSKSTARAGGFCRRVGSRAALLPVVARTESGSVGGASAPPAAAWPPRNRVNLAKVLFSNERTMLAWLQISVLLLLLGVSLLGDGGGGGGVHDGTGLPAAQADGAQSARATTSTPATKIALVAGGVVAPLAVCFVVYSFVVFRRRSARLTAGPAGSGATTAFDDARGAAVLVALVLLAGVASLAAAFARVGEGV